MLVISGTNRKKSNAITIARHYQEILKQHGQKAELLDLTDLPKDFIFSALYDQAAKNQDFNRFQEKIDRHQKLVFIISEYNNSFPGVLKAFIDGLRYPGSLINKKGALVGVSSGPQGGKLALSHFQDILTYMEVIILPRQIFLSLIDKHIQQDRLANAKYREAIEKQARDFIEF